MKATQNSTLSDDEISEESVKVIAFTAGVEQSAISSVSRGGDRCEDSSSCNSSYASKAKTELDLEAEYDLALDDLIKAKKCSIMMLKRLNKSKENVLQLQEHKTK